MYIRLHPFSVHVNIFWYVYYKLWMSIYSPCVPICLLFFYFCISIRTVSSNETHYTCLCFSDCSWNIVSSIGRPFRSPLRRRRNMAALPLPAAILDDLIPSFLVPGMRSSKMAAGSGRAAILRLRLNGDRKGRPKSWLTSFPAPPSWIQDGGATSNVWRTL